MGIVEILVLSASMVNRCCLAVNAHGTLQVQAANEHSHPVCGSSCTDDSSHTNLEFAKLTGSEDTGVR